LAHLPAPLRLLAWRLGRSTDSGRCRARAAPCTLRCPSGPLA